MRTDGEHSAAAVQTHGRPEKVTRVLAVDGLSECAPIARGVIVAIDANLTRIDARDIGSSADGDNRAVVVH